MIKKKQSKKAKSKNPRCRMLQVKRKVGKRTIKVKRKVCRNPTKYTQADLDLAIAWVQHYGNLITEYRAKRQSDKVRKYTEKWNDAVIKRDEIIDYFEQTPQ